MLQQAEPSAMFMLVTAPATCMGAAKRIGQRQSRPPFSPHLAHTVLNHALRWTAKLRVQTGRACQDWSWK